MNKKDYKIGTKIEKDTVITLTKRIISNEEVKIDIEKVNYSTITDTIRLTINVKFPIWITNESLYDIKDIEKFMLQNIKFKLSQITRKL